MTVSKILKSILALLTDPDTKAAKECGCVDIDPETGESIIEIYENDRARYDKNAKEWTQKYAM